jgi:probable lipoprotein NlpC
MYIYLLPCTPLDISADNSTMKRHCCHLRIIHVFALWGALFICARGQVFAAPLERGFALAPAASASKEEKDAAFWDARFKVLAAAGKYERTPYRYGGADYKGIDCSGLVYVSFKEALSVTVPRSAKGLYDWAEKINVEKLQPGDLVFFKTDNSGSVTHVGIYAGGSRFIHSASEGTKTGVIYSGLEESYWARTYYASGRALPGSETVNNAANAADVKTQSRKTGASSPKRDASQSRFMMGIAAAPTWNTFFAEGNAIRGVAGQISLAAEFYSDPMIIGLELRPEWDRVLGIFRLPITLSWGRNEKWRIFAGPVISFGDAALSTIDGTRYYTGGTTWFGAAGFTAAPFAIKISTGNLAPYAEIAWQSYFTNDTPENLGADFAAGLRFSTGFRYTWKL